MNKRWDETKNDIKIKGKLNICPACGSERLDWEGPDTTDDKKIAYDVHCYDCDYRFREWYDLIFVGLWGKPLIKKTKKSKKGTK